MSYMKHGIVTLKRTPEEEKIFNMSHKQKLFQIKEKLISRILSDLSSGKDFRDILNAIESLVKLETTYKSDLVDGENELKTKEIVDS